MKKVNIKKIKKEKTILKSVESTKKDNKNTKKKITSKAIEKSNNENTKKSDTMISQSREEYEINTNNKEISKYQQKK